MIQPVLQHLVHLLLDYLDAHSSGLLHSDEVQLGDLREDTADRLLLSLVHIGREASSGDADLDKEPGVDAVEFHVLCVACHHSHEQALTRLSLLTECLRENAHLDLAAIDPWLAPGHVALEPRALSFEEQHHLWRSLGEVYRPSVLYHVRVARASAGTPEPRRETTSATALPSPKIVAREKVEVAYRALMELELLHDFYRDGVCRDAIIEPLAGTRTLFERHGMILDYRDDRYVVLAPVSFDHGTLTRPLADDAVLQFAVRASAPYFLAGTELPDGFGEQFAGYYSLHELGSTYQFPDDGLLLPLATSLCFHSVPEPAVGILDSRDSVLSQMPLSLMETSSGRQSLRIESVLRGVGASYEMCVEDGSLNVLRDRQLLVRCGHGGSIPLEALGLVTPGHYLATSKMQFYFAPGLALERVVALLDVAVPPAATFGVEGVPTVKHQLFLKAASAVWRYVVEFEDSGTDTPVSIDYAVAFTQWQEGDRRVLESVEPIALSESRRGLVLKHAGRYVDLPEPGLQNVAWQYGKLTATMRVSL